MLIMMLDDQGEREKLWNSLRSSLSQSSQSMMQFLHNQQLAYREHLERLILLRSQHRSDAEAHRLALLRGEVDGEFVRVAIALL